MLRRLRKKLELIEIWGWCPRPTKENLKGAEIPFSDDSWSKVDTICFRLQFYRSLRSLDRFGWFLVHFEALLSHFHILVILGTNLTWIFDEIWCGSLLSIILSLISNAYFCAFTGWIWMIFYAIWSSTFIFSHFGIFGYKSYVEIWCGSLRLRNSLFDSNWWLYRPLGARKSDFITMRKCFLE